jgi:pyruvoyl-dependent arginine decarboxylase (PvlArgDC)
MVEGALPVDKISQGWVAEVSDRIEDETVRAVRKTTARRW